MKFSEMPYKRIHVIQEQYIKTMRQIINFFEQPEYKNKYHNNIISFKAILLAKEGQIDEAVDFFRGNIRDYTEDAKDKFIAKLERYKDE